MLSFVRAAIDQVLGTLTDQINLTEEVLEQVRGAMPGIQSAWVGDDADAFMEEVNSRLIPEIMAAGAAIGGINIGIMKGADVIEQADEKARGMVQDLEGVFEKIF
jgi:uncharacterized protein YukE